MGNVLITQCLIFVIYRRIQDSLLRFLLSTELLKQLNIIGRLSLGGGLCKHMKLFHRGPSKQELLNALAEQRKQTELLQQVIENQNQLIRDLSQTIDARIWKTEEAITERIKALGKTTDERIWKNEENTARLVGDLSQTVDARIWKAEEATAERIKALGKTTDERIWKSEENTARLVGDLSQTIDARIWKAEERILPRFDLTFVDEIHRHIDFTYRDIMVVLEKVGKFLPENPVRLVTDTPIAYESLDHLYPHGTIRDNTRYPRFVEKCEELLGKDGPLAFLDLGCSGGGMVLEAALRGHISIGLEGSDCSLKEQRAEWRLLGDRLQTCDITKPFRLEMKNGSLQLFHIITAWEVLEHIAKEDLPTLFLNIKNHLADNGYFIASIANWNDIDPVSGVNWHVTVYPYQWWKEQFEQAGFVVCSELLQPIDLARGGYNPPHCYETPSSVIDTEKTFHIVVQKKSNK